VSLVARHLEENGIPTVIIGAARDIVEHCGVPRFVFVDFPLGSPMGVPFDGEMQHETLAAALNLLETATGPRAFSAMDHVWPQGDEWKAKIFTADQPFLTEAQVKNWEARKQRYRDQKDQAEG
jgi:hypothetical protein